MVVAISSEREANNNNKKNGTTLDDDGIVFSDFSCAFSIYNRHTTNLYRILFWHFGALMFFCYVHFVSWLYKCVDRNFISFETCFCSYFLYRFFFSPSCLAFHFTFWLRVFWTVVFELCRFCCVFIICLHVLAWRLADVGNSFGYVIDILINLSETVRLQQWWADVCFAYMQISFVEDITCTI